LDNSTLQQNNTERQPDNSTPFEVTLASCPNCGALRLYLSEVIPEPHFCKILGKRTLSDGVLNVIASGTHDKIQNLAISILQGIDEAKGV